MLNPHLPVLVHDTAYLPTPVPAAVTRVTLRPWADALHPDTPLDLDRPMLADALLDAVVRVHDAAPHMRHGILVHAVEPGPIPGPEAPTATTLRQYASQFLRLATVRLDPPLGTDESPYLVVTRPDEKRAVPRWVWTHLAATLLYPAEKIGTPPTTL